jgi:hypothetical protein
MEKGWLDYINPQVYFPFFYRPAPYEKLVDWWSNNAYGKHVYIGHGVYRVVENKPDWRNKSQLPDQVRYLRKNNRVQGSVYFSSRSLTNNLGGFVDSLRNSFYTYPALPPAMLWLDDVAPREPVGLATSVRDKCVLLNWTAPAAAADGDTPFGYVIYRFTEVEDTRVDRPANILKISFNNSTSFLDETAVPGINYRYLVTAIDRAKNESLPSNLASMTVE